MTDDDDDERPFVYEPCNHRKRGTQLVCDRRKGHPEARHSCWNGTRLHYWYDVAEPEPVVDDERPEYIPPAPDEPVPEHGPLYPPGAKPIELAPWTPRRRRKGPSHDD